jgi:hypothetical protein
MLGEMNFVPNTYADKTADKVRALVEKWLDEMRFDVKVVPNANLSFNLAAENGQKRTVHIIQTIEEKDTIEMVARLDLPEQFLSRLSSMNKTTRNKLFWDLRFALLDTQLGFRAIDMPLKSVEVSTRIYLDGLTKDRFAYELFRVRQAITRVFWMIARELGEPEPSKELGYIG